MLRKIFVIILSLTGFLLLSEEKPLQLKLHFRITNPEQIPISEIKKEDFKLFINDSAHTIEHFTKRNRSLAQQSETGRHFFLSFQICNQDKTLTSTISHFLTGILNQKDSLHVVSPVKIYRIPVSENKGAILNRILEIIKSECLPFNQTRLVHEKKIENEIQHFDKMLNNSMRLTIPGLLINRFIDNMTHLFSDYKKEFLMLDMLRYRDMDELFLTLKGDRWWFHFQQNRTLDFIIRFNQLLQSLRQYRYYPLLKTIAQIQNEIKPSRLLPFDSIRELMVENRIRLHVLLIDNVMGNQAGLAVPFGRICQQSGGTYDKVLSPSAALKKIKTHEDSFFEITCHISSEPEARQVLIMSDQDQHPLVYKHRYSHKEISALLTSQAESKMSISNISIKKNAITFMLSDYKINASKGFGLIKIRLNLTTTRDKIIHSTENTLRASRGQTRISVPLPNRPEPVLKLTIIASDILGNHSLRASYQIFPHEHDSLVLPLKSLE